MDLIFEPDRDLREIIKEGLSKFGAQYDSSKDAERNLLNLLDFRRRWVEPKPRSVNISREILSCVKATVISDLAQKIEMGDDINAHLTKRRAKVGQYDALLNDWGLHHLHLCPAPRRTRDVLFVRFSEAEAFFVGFLPHGRGQNLVWVNTNLVQIIHDNWPRLLSGREVKGLAAELLSPQERTNLRAANVNVMISVSDGTTYSPPGSGIVASGHCLDDVMECHRMMEEFRQLARTVQLNPNRFREALGITEDETLHIRIGRHPATGRLFVWEAKRGVGFNLPEYPISAC